jgi:drug/metabolite transporter (DMT)-like permease
MADTTTFRGVIDFFDQVGLYDVVLPFILVFTIVFAILEKTKVLGTEEVSGKHYTRKNLNAMVSFVISFLVIASSQLVEIITTVSSQIVILLMLSVLFLLLVGSFYKDAEGGYLQGGWKTFFIFIMFIGIVLIFLGAIKTGDSDDTWLEVFWNYVSQNGQGGNAVGSIILLILLILLIVYVVRTPKQEVSKKEE